MKIQRKISLIYWTDLIFALISRYFIIVATYFTPNEHTVIPDLQINLYIFKKADIQNGLRPLGANYSAGYRQLDRQQQKPGNPSFPHVLYFHQQTLKQKGKIVTKGVINWGATNGMFYNFMVDDLRETDKMFPAALFRYDAASHCK